MNRILHLLHELFIRNIRLKLLSLSLAFLLWVGINKQPNEPNDTRWLKVPLVVRNIPDDRFELVSDPVYDINVQFTGPSSIVRRLSSDEANAVLDLKNFRPRFTYTLAAADVHVPSYALGKVAVQEIIPNRITMEFEKKASREAVIEVQISGKNEVAKGYQVGTISCQPHTVTIEGPTRQIEQAKIYTDLINLKGAQSTLHQQVRVLSDSPHVRFPPHFTVTEVTVEILQTGKNKSGRP
jgi:YbbR domain-containing protein